MVQEFWSAPSLRPAGPGASASPARRASTFEHVLQNPCSENGVHSLAGYILMVCLCSDSATWLSQSRLTARSMIIAGRFNGHDFSYRSTVSHWQSFFATTVTVTWYHLLRACPGPLPAADERAGPRIRGADGAGLGKRASFKGHSSKPKVGQGRAGSRKKPFTVTVIWTNALPFRFLDDGIFTNSDNENDSS